VRELRLLAPPVLHNEAITGDNHLKGTPVEAVFQLKQCEEDDGKARGGPPCAARQVGHRQVGHTKRDDVQSMWFIGVDDSVVALDLHASTPRALWRVGNLGSPVVAITRGRHDLSVMRGPPDDTVPLQYETFDWTLPQLTLRRRGDVVTGHLGLHTAAVAAGGNRVIGWATSVNGADGPRVFQQRAGIASVVETPGHALPWVAVSAVHAVVSWQHTEGVGLDVHVDDTLAMRLIVGGAKQVCLRLQGRFLVVADDGGRAWAVDLEAKQILTRARALA
jgi:hypothetical protein